ncbi:hypothetical protein ACVZCY_06675 [Klebsiella grimontii]
MIYDILLASILALMMVGYWILCRKRAYEYQKKAAELIKEYFLDGQVSDKDKQHLYQSYVLLRKWYVFPFFAFVTPFILSYMLLMQGKVEVSPAKRGNQELYDKAYDQLMKMALSKNPLISAVSMSFTGISFAVIIPIGLLLRRIYTIPTKEQVTDVLEQMTIKAAQKAHIH